MYDENHGCDVEYLAFHVSWDKRPIHASFGDVQGSIGPIHDSVYTQKWNDRTTIFLHNGDELSKKNQDTVIHYYLPLKSLIQSCNKVSNIIGN